MRKVLRLFIVGVTTVALAAGLSAWLVWNHAYYKQPAIVQKNVIIGNQIVAALRQYHSVYGEFPENLDPLVPAFLPRIEPPDTLSKTWEYRRRQKGPDGFGLSFGSPESMREPTGWINASQKEWAIDYK